MATDPLRVGVVGLGVMGAAHVLALSAHVPGARVVAVHDVDARRAGDVAASVGARTMGSAEALVADGEVDAVVVASPDHTHAPLTLACLAAGKPVLCEKPLGVDVAETTRVVAAEEAAGRRLVTVGFMRRFDPGYLELRETVRGGLVGEPVLVHCVHRNAAPHPEATTEGVVGNSMVHELDILPWLTGLPVTGIEVRSPRAEGLREPQLAVVELGGGRVLATVEVFLSARYGYDVRCEVVGTEGTVSLRPPAGLTVARDGRAGVAVPADFRERFAEAYRAELAAWVVAATGGGATGASVQDGHRATLAAAAGIASLHTGQRKEVVVSATPPPPPSPTAGFLRAPVGKDPA